MKAKYLLIDVGNGRTKLGLSTHEEILELRTLPTLGVTQEAIRAVTQGWEWDWAVLASVVPGVVPVWQSACSRLHHVNHEVPLGIGIRYPNPASIGADRLANACALAQLYGAPGIVIDFGTAVTFDILSGDREYLGGVIAPGLRLMTDYLHERTALLPKVELREPLSAIGTSTEKAILAGAAIGYRGMVTGILAALKEELVGGAGAHIVATGGDAEWIISGLGELVDKIHVDADLTLHGLRLAGNFAALSHG